jgi:lipopolysaccharide export LptBFGC system permease protein LptF
MKLKFKSQQSAWEKFRSFLTYDLPEFAAKFSYVPPFPAQLTIDDWINLSLDVSASASQFQKAYDWKISQWSSFANMILTALVSFLSACAVEFYKSGLSDHTFDTRCLLDLLEPSLST